MSERCIRRLNRYLASQLARFALASIVLATSTSADADEPKSLVTLNDDGGWCWFQDERVVVDRGRLIFGSVANGSQDASRRGDVDVATFDLATGKTDRFELFDQLETDDHDVPALWVRPDGRLLAVFAKHYAWWDGVEWKHQEIAYAGTRLYAGEDDYTGNICLDPQRLDTVYLSTNADPETGQALISKSDGKRHYEIYRGRTVDGGKSWVWRAITSDSMQDNLRPIVPTRDRGAVALLWFRGRYNTYRDYQTQVVGLIPETSQ